jgi:plasmid stabilization system protein ParE
MKQYKVQWTKNAIYDLEDIIKYLKIDSIKIAKSIFYEIKDECQKLYFFPERKRVVPELQQIGITKYRELIYKRWRIIFKIQEDKVFILLVADSSRNLEDILYQRLLKG